MLESNFFPVLAQYNMCCVQVLSSVPNSCLFSATVGKSGQVSAQYMARNVLNLNFFVLGDVWWSAFK